MDGLVVGCVQGYELNRNGELYVIRKPGLKTKIVDGTSLAVAAVLHMIPRGARDVLLLGKESKVVSVLAQALCERDIQVQHNTVLNNKSSLTTRIYIYLSMDSVMDDWSTRLIILSNRFAWWTEICTRRLGSRSARSCGAAWPCPAATAAR